MIKFGGMRVSSSGSVVKSVLIFANEWRFTGIAYLVFSLFVNCNCYSVLLAVDGDPQIEVPTLQQGRALLARDMLHKQCEEAIQSRDGKRLDQLVGRAIAEEKLAFGSNFGGSDLTIAYRSVASMLLGEQPESVTDAQRQFSQQAHELSNLNALLFRTMGSQLPNDLRVEFPSDVSKAQKDFEKDLTLLEQAEVITAELQVVLREAYASNDFTDADPKIEAAYEVCKKAFDQFVPQGNAADSPLTNSEPIMEDTLRDYFEGMYSVSLLYSQVKQRAGEQDEARRLARQALSLAKKANAFWEYDTRPIIGGRAIAQHLLAVLNADLGNQRTAGDWKSAVATVDEMLPLAKAFWDAPQNLHLMRDEAIQLSKLSESAQSDYAATILKQVDFESAANDRRFRDAIEIGVDLVEQRIQLLGNECVEAARINRRLGYLYWTQNDYANAFTRLADASSVLAKKVPKDDSWLLGAIADLYINASLLAQTAPVTSEVSTRLEKVVDSLSTHLTEEHHSVAEGKLALHGLKFMQTRSSEQREKILAFNVLVQNLNSLYNNGKFVQAAVAGKLLMEQASTLFGNPSAQHLNQLRSYANCLTKSGDPDSSIALYRDLLERYDVPPYNRTSDFHWVYHGIADTLRTLGGRENNLEAIKWLAKARKLTLESLGEQTTSHANHLELEGEILRDNLSAPLQALSKFQEAIAIHETVDGNRDSFNYCQSLVQIGLCENELRLWDAANDHLVLALEIRERNGYQSPYMMTWNLWALGTNSFDRQEFSEAAEYFSRALAIEERETPNASAIASHYGNLLVSFLMQQDGALQAQEVLQQFLVRRGALHSEAPERFADECRDACSWLFDNPGELSRGDMSKERQRILEELIAVGLRSYEAAGISSDWRLLELQRMSGLAAEILNERHRAFAIYRDLLERAATLSPPPYSVIGSIHQGLSNLYKEEFALDRTIHHRRLAVEALELEYGEHSMQVAQAIRGEADILLALGDYSRAEELTQRAADIFTELGHPMQAEVYQQLAVIHLHREDYDLAEQYLHAARVRLSNLRSHHELDLNIRYWLARLMLTKGEYSQALEIASQLIESVSDSSDVQFASSVRSIQGIARLGLAQSQEAHIALKEVIDAAEQNPLVQVSDETRAAYAAACECIGDGKEANNQFRLLISKLAEQHEVFGNVLSERQKLEMRSKLSHATSIYVSHVVGTGDSLSECYKTIMPLKGLVSAGQRRQQSHDEIASPEVRALSAQIDQINQKLSSLLFGSTPSAQTASVEQIGQLTNQRESLELQRNALEEATRTLSNHLSPDISLEQLQESLQEDEALIDFVTYVHHSQPGLPNSKTEDQVLAFVVTKVALNAIPLGPASELRTISTQWRDTLQSGSDMEFTASNRKLAGRVWDPVKHQVGDARVVLLSPDGVLSNVSFAAFPSDDDGYLVDDRTFITVSGPRLLVQSRAREAALEKAAVDLEDKKTLLLVGGVNYDSRSSESKLLETPLDLIASNSNGPSSPSTALRSASSVTSWPYLPGTEAEVHQVASLAKNSGVASSTVTLEGENSSETSLAKLASGATWIHLATHGFFAESKVNPGGWAFQSLSRQSVVGFDPRLLTGIVLAGANQSEKTGMDDGILTAAEIEHLDLSKTKLLVLSACESALGEEHSGEGVMGLQRSLHLAGCHNVIASLWKVDDQATATLMTEFYRQLWEENKTPSEALRSAQQKLSRSRFENGSIVRGDSRLDFGGPQPSKSKPRSLSPKFWAAFCVSIN